MVGRGKLLFKEPVARGGDDAGLAAAAEGQIAVVDAADAADSSFRSVRSHLSLAGT